MPLYFAYGSNLLAERIHLSARSARFVSIARLPEHELTFGSDSEGIIRGALGGSAAAIRPKAGSSVWGALWDVSDEDLRNLDGQEKALSRQKIVVETPPASSREAEVYVMPEVMTQDEQIPSPKYLQIMIAGAREIQLPAEYIETLERLPHNGSTVPLALTLSIFRES